MPDWQLVKRERAHTHTCTRGIARGGNEAQVRVIKMGADNHRGRENIKTERGVNERER